MKSSVDNIENIETLKKRLDELESLLKVDRVLSSILEPMEIYVAMAELVQEKLVDDSIRILGNNPTLIFLVYAMTGKAARHKLRMPAWIFINIFIANRATLWRTLYNSSGQYIGIKTDMDTIAHLRIEVINHRYT